MRDAPAADIAVVGGGVIGCAVARALALRGATVDVLERGVPGREATRAAAGMLAPWSEPGSRAFLDLALRSLAAYPTWAEALEEESGLRVGLDISGKLDVAFHEGEAEALRPAVERAGGALEWVDRDALRDLEPDLDPAAVGAAWSPSEGSVDNRLLVRALWVAAARAGVRFRLGREVVSVAPASGGGVRIALRGGRTLRADKAVVAAGAWSGRIGGAPGALPVRPVRGQMAALSTPDGPRHVVYGPGGYALRRGAGLALVGATEEEAGFDNRTTAAGVAAVLGAWARLFPARAHAALAATWSGLRPGTPDGDPILGPHPGGEDVWYATGHFRNGILLAPETARLCAAALLDGHAPPRAFRPDRFPRAGENGGVAGEPSAPLRS